MSSTNGFDMDSIEDSIEEIVMMMERSDWIKGISFSVAASIIGGASKLAIRKSWLLEEVEEERVLRGNSGALDDENDDDHNNYQQQQGPVAVVNQNHHHHPTGSTTTTDRRRPHFRTTFWSLVWRSTGMFGMTILNPLCSVIAMNYASPSITAPFSGLTLVWIVLFSDCLIGEKPSMVQMVAAALIVLGETIVAVWGDHTSDNGVTLDDVVREKMAVKGRHSMFLRFPSRSPHFFVPLRKSKNETNQPTKRRNIPIRIRLLSSIVWPLPFGRSFSSSGCGTIRRPRCNDLRGDPRAGPLPVRHHEVTRSSSREYVIQLMASSHSFL
jgi:hypothetical protein